LYQKSVVVPRYYASIIDFSPIEFAYQRQFPGHRWFTVEVLGGNFLMEDCEVPPLNILYLDDYEYFFPSLLCALTCWHQHICLFFFSAHFDQLTNSLLSVLVLKDNVVATIRRTKIYEGGQVRGALQTAAVECPGNFSVAGGSPRSRIATLCGRGLSGNFIA
jgi:hypothetical protein